MNKYVIVIILMFILILQGCAHKAGKKAEAGDNSDNAAAEASTSGLTTGATQAAQATTEPEATATVQPTDLVLPVADNETGKVLIQTVSASLSYKTTSFILTSAEGESVVVDPTSMPKKAVVDLMPAAIVSTHNHPDHTDVSYVKEYNESAQLIQYVEGELQTKDFHIYTVDSSHGGDTINGSNYIIVFEVDGLRIAHMGDVGQTSLTEDQLEEIGTIDIAFMQFENSYSDMSIDNRKGFTIIEQLNPKIVIPTHYTDKSRALLEEKYGTVTVIENLMEISKEDLPETNLNVYEMTNTHKYR